MASTVHRHTMDLAGIDVPVVDLAGGADGPRLTVIAGVHGCEYASIAGVRQWIKMLTSQEDSAGGLVRGSVRAVPVLNIPAFHARSPFVIPQDGKNLNRCFPGDPSGTLADRLAHAAFTQLITGSDAVVDAHCGDQPEALEPFTLYDAGPAEETARAMAVGYGLGYVIRQQPGPERAVGGTTSSSAAEIGIPAITAEAGGCGIVERHAVDLHVRGLNQVLAVLGMADVPAAGAGLTPQPTMLSRFIWLRSERGGWWQPDVVPGEQVTEGQLLGTISTLDGGEVLQEIRSPAPGAPMFITSSPAVPADGLLLGLGAV